ncbi:MAG TPA: hypothetical protein VFR05_01680 [Terriglobia bacterium]|nr:hypothetical protein [Terriglobia bacterium]
MPSNRLYLLPLVVLALGLPSLYVRAADTVPEQISDSAFWKLVEDFSEPGGTFESDNWISNETGIQAVIPRLNQLTKRDGVYLGVGPEQNFTFIAAMRPKIAFIIDIRRQNMVQHMIYKALFEMSASRADFLSRLFSRPRPAGLTENSTVGELFRAYNSARADDAILKNTLQGIKQLLIENHKFGLTAEDVKDIDKVLTAFRQFGPAVNYSAGGLLVSPPDLPNYADLMTATDPQGQERSYLANEENYQFVRSLHRRNLLVPLTGDFGGTKAIEAVAKYLKDHGAVVTAFYVSNVESYLFRVATGRLDAAANGGSKNFYDNVAALPLDSSSTFIRSWNGVFGPLPPGGMPYTMLSSMEDMLEAVRDGRIQAFRDVISLSK